MIQRWKHDGSVLRVSTVGQWVKYADHAAAVAEAAEAAIQRAEDAALVHGALNERARIKAAVEAMPRTGGWTTPDGVIHEVDRAAVLSIIDGEE